MQMSLRNSCDVSFVVAEALLKDKEAGAFLVRDSTSFRGSFGLAMKVDQTADNPGELWILSMCFYKSRSSVWFGTGKRAMMKATKTDKQREHCAARCRHLSIPESREAQIHLPNSADVNGHV